MECLVELSALTIILCQQVTKVVVGDDDAIELFRHGDDQPVIVGGRFLTREIFAGRQQDVTLFIQFLQEPVVGGFFPFQSESS